MVRDDEKATLACCRHDAVDAASRERLVSVIGGERRYARHRVARWQAATLRLGGSGGMAIERRRWHAMSLVTAGEEPACSPPLPRSRCSRHSIPHLHHVTSSRLFSYRYIILWFNSQHGRENNRRHTMRVTRREALCIDGCHATVNIAPTPGQQSAR